MSPQPKDPKDEEKTHPDHPEQSEKKDTPPGQAKKEEKETLFPGTEPTAPADPDPDWKDRPDEGPELGVTPEVDADEQEELEKEKAEDPALAPPGYSPAG